MREFEFSDMADLLRNQTVNIVNTSGREFLGLTLVKRHPILGMFEFEGGGVGPTYIRESSIAAIEVWNV
jgi:hypothetical protein